MFDRRAFLRIGSIATFGSLTWGDVLRLRAAAPRRRNATSRSFICGWRAGLSHLDTFDMKLDADRKYRSVFKLDSDLRSRTADLRASAAHGQADEQGHADPVDDAQAVGARRGADTDAERARRAADAAGAVDGFGDVQGAGRAQRTAAVCGDPAASRQQCARRISRTEVQSVLRRRSERRQVLRARYGSADGRRLGAHGRAPLPSEPGRFRSSSSGTPPTRSRRSIPTTSPRST